MKLFVSFLRTDAYYSKNNLVLEIFKVYNKSEKKREYRNNTLKMIEKAGEECIA